MKDSLHLFMISMKNRLQDEDGQGMIEYALVVALVAFGATAAMGTLATAIGTAFTTLATKLGTKVV